MNAKVDHYLAEGCGRCSLGATPKCKVHNWPEELKLLRKLVLECGLTEELKWGVPCYTFQKKNIAIVAAFKEHCALSFFKGVLLKDSEEILKSPGENSQSVRYFKFTKVQEILKLQATIKAYVFEAIEVEKAGLKIDFKQKNELVFAEELKDKLNEDPIFKKAFEALTPGRQRGYNLFFSAPKQAKTRKSRIEKYVSQILNGKGMHDR